MKNQAAVTKAEEKEYFKEAQSWDRDLIAEIKQSRRVAWYVASGALILASLAVGAIFFLIPLHTIEPYLVRVDASTGIVDQVVKIKDAKSDYDEILSKYFLRRVVTLRESYTRAQLEYNYKQVFLFTAPNARPELKQAFAFENPNGPYKRYGELGTSIVQIKNISFISKSVAQIRYVRIDRKAGAESPSHWVATIEFRYVSQPASEEARGINPLGFQVTSYRNDPEAVIEDSKPADAIKQPEAEKAEALTVPAIPAPKPIEVPNPPEPPKPIITRPTNADVKP